MKTKKAHPKSFPKGRTLKTVLLCLILLPSLWEGAGMGLFAQNIVPAGFNYQAIARDSLGSPKANQSVTLKFTIEDQYATSIPWVETHTITTDQFGLFTAVIGQGTKIGGTAATFSVIDWKAYNYYVKTEIQVGINWLLIGKEPLLSVPYAMVAKEAIYSVPAGTIVPYGGVNIPSGWLLCDGTNYTVTQYPELYVAIGINFGGVSGANFNVPDFRGRFLRGVSDTTNNDPDKTTRTAINTGGNSGNNVGSLQGDAFQDHWHWYRTATDDGVAGSQFLRAATGATNSAATNQITGAYTDGINGIPRTTSETRPKNVYVNYIIKY